MQGTVGTRCAGGGIKIAAGIQTCGDNNDIEEIGGTLGLGVGVSWGDTVCTTSISGCLNTPCDCNAPLDFDSLRLYGGSVECYCKNRPRGFW